MTRPETGNPLVPKYSLSKIKQGILLWFRLKIKKTWNGEELWHMYLCRPPLTFERSRRSCKRGKHGGVIIRFKNDFGAWNYRLSTCRILKSNRGLNHRSAVAGSIRWMSLAGCWMCCHSWPHCCVSDLLEKGWPAKSWAADDQRRSSNAYGVTKCSGCLNQNFYSEWFHCEVQGGFLVSVWEAAEGRRLFPGNLNFAAGIFFTIDFQFWST